MPSKFDDIHSLLLSRANGWFTLRRKITFKGATIEYRLKINVFALTGQFGPKF